MRACVKSHLITLGAITLGALASVSAAQAQDAAAMKKAIEDRQQLFKSIDESFKPVGEMLKRKMKYDSAVVVESATKTEAHAKKIADAFKVDTHKAEGVETKARENIWTNMADFKAKNDALVTALGGLAAAGKTGDEKAFRPAAVAVGKACSACHDNYKDS
jgi:cytochrome c556